MGKQFARLVMAHIDCDTIPFFWRYASRFTIFDNVFATEDTPSTPNAVAMIAGQSGETQWVKHPGATANPADDGFTGPISGTINGKTYSGSATTQGPPLVEDPQPWWGSEFDDTTIGREPAGAAGKEFYASSNIASNLTFASLPLSFMARLDQLVHRPGSEPRFRPPRRPQGHRLHRRPWRRAGPVALVPERLRSGADGRRRPGLAPELRQPPQRPAIFRLSRQQSGGGKQSARRGRLLRRHGEGRTAAKRRSLLPPRRLL